MTALNEPLIVGGGKQSTFGTNPHLLSYFEVKVDKIHFWGEKSTLALFSAILGVKVDFSFWHLNALIHYFEKILGSTQCGRMAISALLATGNNRPILW